MKIFAYTGAQIVTIAHPIICNIYIHAPTPYTKTEWIVTNDNTIVILTSDIELVIIVRIVIKTFTLFRCGFRESFDNT